MFLISAILVIVAGKSVTVEQDNKKIKIDVQQ